MTRIALIDAHDEIEAVLENGEELLWCGRPPLGIVFRIGDIAVIPASLVLGWVTSYIAITAAVENAPLGLLLPATFMALVGLYTIIGRFWMDALRRRRTFYGVTSQRIVVRYGLIFRRLRSIDVRMLSDVSLVERGHGAGIIMFGSTPPTYGWRAVPSLIMFGHTGPLFFEVASNVRGVYGIVQYARDKAIGDHTE